jgi:hypothetical protein
MINYQETIEQLESEIVAIGSILPDASELTREAMQDAITLLKHYREGLENMSNQNIPTPNKSAVLNYSIYARKTLEGPK